MRERGLVVGVVWGGIIGMVKERTSWVKVAALFESRRYLCRAYFEFPDSGRGGGGGGGRGGGRKRREELLMFDRHCADEC